MWCPGPRVVPGVSADSRVMKTWAQSSHGRANLGSQIPFCKTAEPTHGERVAPSLQ